MLTAAPVDTAAAAGVGEALVAWLRAVSAASAAAVVLLAVCAEVTVPATACEDWVPFTVPPAVLTQMFFRVSGLCQNCGATSMTTWYWFSGL